MFDSSSKTNDSDGINLKCLIHTVLFKKIIAVLGKNTYIRFFNKNCYGNSFGCLYAYLNAHN